MAVCDQYPEFLDDEWQITTSDGPATIDYYTDKAGLEIAETENAPSTMAINSRVELATSTITTPNGNSLDNYKSIEVQAEEVDVPRDAFESCLSDCFDASSRPRAARR